MRTVLNGLVLIVGLLFLVNNLYAQPNAWINEFHYDNNSTDVDEFVEVVAPSDFTDLANLTVTLYNGNGGASYGSYNLDGFVVGSTEGGFTIYYGLIPGIQNGAPDGLALSYSGTLIEFISYEGSFTATGGPALNTVSTDVGVSEPATTAVGESLQRTGTGTAAADFSWTGPAADSKGSINTGQAFSAGGDNPPSITNIVWTPLVPNADQNTAITADVTDDNSLSSVKLVYSINGGDEDTVSMTARASYSGDIPASEYNDGNIVMFRILATDNTAQITQSSTYSFFAGTTNIAVLKTNDANGFPLYDDYYAKITGIATVENGIFSSSSIDVNIQDATGGINVFKSGAAGDFVFVRGNSYTVTGVVDFYNGKIEVIPNNAATDIVDNGAGTPPDFEVKSLAELLSNPEFYESMLVGIVGVTMTSGTWPAAGSDANLTITDDGGTSSLTLRIDKDTDIDGTAEPVWPRDVIGIFSQFDNSSPYSDGYQIIPRDTNDLRDNNTIPVELVSFAAELNGDEVVISWKTATETNNLGFEVQKSGTDKIWNKIGFVKGNNGTEIRGYSFIDNALSGIGTYYYRLKQIDFDGSYVYSMEVEVNVNTPSEFNLTQNFPNPFNPTTTIKYSIPSAGVHSYAPVQLKVYDVLGKEVAVLVNENKPAGNYKVEFVAGSLASGIYFYKLQTAGYTLTRKMLLMK